MAENNIRLYMATKRVEVLFVCPESANAELAGVDWVIKDLDLNGPDASEPVFVKELTDICQVPKAWLETGLWGAEAVGLDPDTTPLQFFVRKKENEEIMAEIKRHEKAIDELKKKLTAL